MIDILFLYFFIVEFSCASLLNIIDRLLLFSALNAVFFILNLLIDIKKEQTLIKSAYSQTLNKGKQ